MIPEYYVKRILDPGKRFINYCYKNISCITWNGKDKLILSNRKYCEQITKKLTKKSKLTFYDKRYLFTTLACNETRIEIQTYEFVSEYENGKQIITYRLYNLEVFENDKHIKVSINNGDYKFGLKNSYMGGPYKTVDFYTRSYNQLKKSPLKYLKPFEYNNDYIYMRRIYKYRKEIEFAQKINAYKLADEIISGYANMREVNKKWLVKNKKYLKNTKASYKYIKQVEEIIKRGGTPIKEFYKILSYCDIASLPTNIDINKLQRWAIKNEISFYYYYFDYLKLLKNLDIEIDNNNAFPKNLEFEHNRLVDRFNELEDLEKQEKYNVRLSDLKHLEKNISGYMFVIPKNAKEIIKEGQELDHCVGTYVDEVVNGETIIIFVRQEKDKPLYTMEFKDNHIEQLRGKNNQDPPEEVLKVTKKWLSEIKKIEREKY